MFGSQYRPPSRKSPLGKAKRMGRGKPAGGQYQAGYQAAMRDMKARKGSPGKPGRSYRSGREIPASYGDDSESFGQRGYLPRVGWRW